jgi:hypothetical protein
MSILPQKSPREKHWSRCGRCKRNVISAVDSDGAELQVEWRIAGKGTLGLVAPLIPGSPLLAVDSGGTNYGPHRCPGALKAHSADSFGAPKQATGPNISYRPSGTLRRGRR